MMADDELPDVRATASATRTPLEDDPALRDPAAALVVDPGVTGAAAGTLDVSARVIRRDHLRQLLRSPAFLIGLTILLWWVVCALFGKTIAPYDPDHREPAPSSTSPRRAPTGSAPTRSGGTCSPASSSVPATS